WDAAAPASARAATRRRRSRRGATRKGRRTTLATARDATVSIPLIPNQSMFEQRHQQLDLRFSRMFTVGTSRLRANVDLYNVVNRATILATNTTYGAAWGNVTQIINGRLLRLGVQWDF